MKHLASFMALAMLSVSAFAADLYVPSQYSTIQSAIDAAAASGDTIHVAAGTYYESITWAAKSLTLQGAGQGQSKIDGGGAGRCLFLVDVPSPSRIDGFTIQNGNADEGGGLRVLQSTIAVSRCAFTNNTSQDGGGAMLNQIVSGSVTDCTFTNNTAHSTIYGLGGGAVFNQYGGPSMTNCTFTGNTAYNRGGAIHNEESSPAMTNCAFTDNSVTSSDGYQGGGVFNGNVSSPVLTDCTFTGNSSSLGGGMRNSDGSSPTLTSCTFTNNTSSNGGGGMANTDGCNPTVTGCTFTNNRATWRGGGMYNRGSTPSVTNCIFTGNFSSLRGGGGMYTQAAPGVQTIVNCTFIRNSTDQDGGGLRVFDANAVVTNCTFTGNEAAAGGGLETGGIANVTLVNCILWGNLVGGELALFGGPANISYSDIRGGFAGVGNVDVDPLFVGAPGNVRLMGASPCVNSGSNAAVTVATDLDGNARIVFGTVDMGAYEATLASMIEGLCDRVDALVAGGAVLPADGHSLCAKLDAALAKVNAGNNNGAIGSLKAFANQVQAFITTHKLTSAQGQPLIDSANALIVLLGG